MGVPTVVSLVLLALLSAVAGQDEAACCGNHGGIEFCFVGTETACASEGGEFIASHETCNGDECPVNIPTGACCGDGVFNGCGQFNPAGCEQEEAEYQGDGTTCDICEQRACCGIFNGDPFCIRTTANHCEEEGGRFFDTLDECAGGECPANVDGGACCGPTVGGSVRECAVFSSEACDLQGGSYQGDGSSCSDSCVPERACCGVHDGNPFCIRATSSQCANEGGHFIESHEACNDNQCPVAVNSGACCGPSVGGDVRDCGLFSREACAEAGGDYQGDNVPCSSACDATPPPEERACCGVFDGSPFCLRTTVDHCEEEGGRFFNTIDECTAQDECPTNVASGACCGPLVGDVNVDCAQFSEESCHRAGGQYQGNGASCGDACDSTPSNELACCGAFDNNRFCIRTTPAHCEEEGGHFTSEQECLSADTCPVTVAEGACCGAVSNGADLGCVHATRESCHAHGGDYAGDGTTCSPDRCDPEPALEGACCGTINNQAFCIVTNAEHCSDEGGRFFADQNSCPANQCPEFVAEGGCCGATVGDVDFACLIASRESCERHGGDFVGDNTDCSAPACDATGTDDRRACCGAIEGDRFCVRVTQQQCAQEGGRFLSDHFECSDSDLCPAVLSEGACCSPTVNGDIRECSIAARESCGRHGGQYQGDNTRCDNECVDRGDRACCGTFAGVAFCDVTSRDACDELEGQFTDALSCTDNACASEPNRDGACCGAVISPALRVDCALFSERACEEHDGEFLGVGTECARDNCVLHNDDVSACCGFSFNQAWCVDTTNEECERLDGQFASSLGVRCDRHDACPFQIFDIGSCCLSESDVRCAQFTGRECERVDGEHFEGVHCEDACPIPSRSDVGACCGVSDNREWCEEVVLDRCLAEGGHFHGVDVRCGDEAECPVTQERHGGCCFGRGDCADFSRSECERHDGLYLGDGEPCADCADAIGACCGVWDGRPWCVETTATHCGDEGGVFRLDGVCDTDNGCPVPVDHIGACCFGDHCGRYTEVECELAGGEYGGHGSVCELTCVSDTDVGACCFDSDCSILAVGVCRAEGGSFVGANTQCGLDSTLQPTECPIELRRGACCSPDGTCRVTTADDCRVGDGVYGGHERACSDVPCLSAGACCGVWADERACFVVSEDVCEREGGSFQGVFTSCGFDSFGAQTECPAAIPTGACCDVQFGSDRACAIYSDRACDSAGGEFQGANTECDGFECRVPNEPEGACCGVHSNERFCFVATENQCEREGGEYIGDNTACTEDIQFQECPAPDVLGVAVCQADITDELIEDLRIVLANTLRIPLDAISSDSIVEVLLDICFDTTSKRSVSLFHGAVRREILQESNGVVISYSIRDYRDDNGVPHSGAKAVADGAVVLSENQEAFGAIAGAPVGAVGDNYDRSSSSSGRSLTASSGCMRAASILMAAGALALLMLW